MSHTLSDEDTIDQNCRRNALDYVPWQDREALICYTDPCRYAYSIAPFGNQFLIHPVLNDETVLLLVWDGLKMDFENSDPVPWPEHAAEAVAAYIKWKILLVIDKRPDLAAQWYLAAAGNRPASGVYARLRLALFLEQQEALTANGRDQEYQINTTPDSEVIVGFGAQNVAFLSTVTTLEGTGQTALAAVPTTGLTIPFAVQIDIGFGYETWILKTGTDATDTPAGVLRGNDYSVSNTRVWYRQG